MPVHGVFKRTATADAGSWALQDFSWLKFRTLDLAEVSAPLDDSMLDEFIQVVVTLDIGSETNIHLDGSITADGTVADSVNPYGDQGAALGRTNGQVASEGGAFGGEIAIFRIHDGALSGQQVNDLYKAVIPEPASLALLGLGLAGLLGRRPRRRT